MQALRAYRFNDNDAIPFWPAGGYTVASMTEIHAGLPDIVTLLKRSDFFSRLLQDDMYWIASRSELASYPAGSVLFNAGDMASRFFIISSGTVAVSRIDAAGHSEEMARFVAGDVVGDFDFSRGAAYDAVATCVDDSAILAFPGGTLTMGDLTRERPDISARILLRTVAMISSRVRSTQALISDNAPWVRELRRQMFTDASTGLWSRAFLDDELSRSLEPPAAIVLCKPDHFKELCDTWTHSAGDAAMERIAAILKDEARGLRKAWAIRLRSNETAIVASDCRPAEALALAGRLEAAFSAIDLTAVTGDPEFRLSASIAVASWPEDGQHLGDLVQEAYGLMLRAWKDGGGRVYTLCDQILRHGSPEVRR